MKRGTFQLKMFCSEIMSNYFIIPCVKEVQGSLCRFPVGFHDRLVSY